MIDRLTLRGNVVLVLLAPSPEDQVTASGLILTHALKPVTCYGRVLRTGPRVEDVATGDMVAFPPSVGEPYTYRNYAFLFLREPEISFVITKDTPES